MLSSVPRTINDWKADWHEDAKNDWKADWVPPVAGVAVFNSIVPTITVEMAAAGYTVAMISGGVWGGTAPINIDSLQWLADGLPIPGATGLQYMLQESDIGKMIALRITSSNPFGAATATSVAIGPIDPVPA